MTREFIDSQVKDRETADAIESCYRRWMKEFYSLFAERKSDG